MVVVHLHMIIIGIYYVLEYIRSWYSARMMFARELMYIPVTTLGLLKCIVFRFQYFDSNWKLLMLIKFVLSDNLAVAKGDSS